MQRQLEEALTALAVLRRTGEGRKIPYPSSKLPWRKCLTEREYQRLLLIEHQLTDVLLELKDLRANIDRPH
jgi:hypothetical protein